MEPNNEYYDLTTGMHRLVRDKLREATRTGITLGAAVSHLREVICAWFRTQYARRGGRIILFRILWRAVLEQNDLRFMSSEQLSTMLDTIFTSNELQAFSAIELNAPRYAAELTHMVNTWDTITLASTQIQDFKLFVTFKKTKMQVVDPDEFIRTDELHLADAEPVEILLYYCYRYGKEKESGLGTDSGIGEAIGRYYQAKKDLVDLMEARMTELIVLVDWLYVD